MVYLSGRPEDDTYCNSCGGVSTVNIGSEYVEIDWVARSIVPSQSLSSPSGFAGAPG